MADDRKLSASEAEQIIARAASLDAAGEGGSLSAEDIRASALAAGIAPHAVERALREARAPVALVPTHEARFMGLASHPRASVTVSRSSALSVSAVAASLRATLGPDARISEELGTVRAKMAETVVTVVPGTPTTVSVSADQSAGVAVTAIGSGIGGMIAMLFALLPLGLGPDGFALLMAIVTGGAGGLYAWSLYWRRFLGRKSRDVNAIASTVAAVLSES